MDDPNGGRASSPAFSTKKDDKKRRKRKRRQQEQQEGVTWVPGCDAIILTFCYADHSERTNKNCSLLCPSSRTG